MFHQLYPEFTPWNRYSFETFGGLYVSITKFTLRRISFRPDRERLMSCNYRHDRSGIYVSLAKNPTLIQISPLDAPVNPLYITAWSWEHFKFKHGTWIHLFYTTALHVRKPCLRRGIGWTSKGVYRVLQHPAIRPAPFNTGYHLDPCFITPHHQRYRRDPSPFPSQ